jgi:hypothetical protein
MRLTLKPEQMRKGDMLVETGQVVSEVRYTNSMGTAFGFTTGLGLLLAKGTGYEIERPVIPGGVAIDTYSAYVFSNDEDGVPFTAKGAIAFAKERNEGLKIPTYQVFLLTPVEA